MKNINKQEEVIEMTQVNRVWRENFQESKKFKVKVHFFMIKFFKIENKIIKWAKII